MKVVASPEAVEFIRDRGGSVFVWTDRTRCCSGVTFLEAATDSPGADRRFRRMLGGDFELYFDSGVLGLPDELHLEVKGWRRKQVRAYWNGCAYAL